jgi:multimeric flavodoxin WrbA
MSVKSLLIVYHSQSGCCAKLAAAAADGAAREDGVTVVVRRAWDAGTQDLVAADGLLLVAAENSGTLSGGAKDFLDRTFYPSIESGLVLPYALILSAGNDGRGAQQQAQKIFSGYPFVAATEPLIVRGELSAQHLVACEELGQGLAAGLVMGIF